MKTNDLTIVDADKPLMIEVTKSDVTRSVKGNPDRCAIALAIKRKYHVDAVKIHKSRAYVLRGRRWYRYIVPMSARFELLSFDRGATFEPGTYRLCTPAPTERRFDASKAGAIRVYKGTPAKERMKDGKLVKGKSTTKPRTDHIHRTRNVRHDMPTGWAFYDELGIS